MVTIIGKRELYFTLSLLVPFVLCASFCDPQGPWKQVWRDDFKTLDQSSWGLTLGQSDGEGRDAWLTADNVYIENGVLVIRSQKQSTNGHNYTSGALTTQNKRFWKYGRFCVSARLPGGGTPGQGQGIWPAHWMMPNDASCWPDHGEIDILEMINGNNVLYGTYHWNDKYPGQPCIYTGTQAGGSSNSDGTWASKFHEYSVEWGPDYITFLYDSKPYYNVTSSVKAIFPPSPMFLILNTAVGGPWPGPPSPNTMFPTYHYVDYVAVSQRS